MTEQNLGKIERVDIREVWADEASDFTPWLANNLDRLGDELGMELELVQTEAPVGNYYLDILARNVNGGDMVAIENQIAGTDHTHLGQLMTYAAGHDAGVVIWVATKFRDEHRAALDWLNERSAASLDFFGVEIEAIKIGDSLPAPLFRLAVVPNAWSKQVRSSPTTGLTDSQQRYAEFWRPLFGELSDRLGLKITMTNSSNEYVVSSGFGGITYRMRLAWQNEVRVELMIGKTADKVWNKRVFDLLKKSQTDIQTNLGEELIWERRDHLNSCLIAVSTSGSVEDAKEELDEVRRWMIEYLIKFRSEFKPYLDDAVEKARQQ